MSFETNEHAQAYWKENLRLLITLLVIWFTVSFGFGILLVEQLNNIQLFGFKLGFWFAQQGSIYAFVVLVFVYARRMDTLDRHHGVAEDENGEREDAKSGAKGVTDGPEEPT